MRIFCTDRAYAANRYGAFQKASVQECDCKRAGSNPPIVLRAPRRYPVLTWDMPLLGAGCGWEEDEQKTQELSKSCAALHPKSQTRSSNLNPNPPNRKPQILDGTRMTQTLCIRCNQLQPEYGVSFFGVLEC
eukprot:796009-Rhodomonas_salina.1